jgi:two-component system, chemotaxis family, CheB/CheR fusion protein
MATTTAAEKSHGSRSATRIVGIGASAGGLAAIEDMLARVPENSGLAFVVVQHLDPTQKALLPELLQRATRMHVHEAEHLMRIVPDSVYVIPPNAEITVRDDVLHLARPVEPRGLRLPVNVLFSSLASGQGERAIGAVLSGMGSDGTLGAQAIKAVGGLVVVQEPASAQFDSMPGSAIAAGCADIVAPPGELPGRILEYLSRLADFDSASAAERSTSPSPSPPLTRILERLHARVRHDFSLYKPSTLHRRIERRMAIHGIASQALYAEFLDKNPQEADLLFKELLIGVTSFFRDRAVWEQLAAVTLPELLARRKAEPALRAWVVGCSTGEEAYSLAMIFNEVTQRLARPEAFQLQIFASDLSPDAIDTARRGRYPLSIGENVSADRLAHFFTRHDTYYEINTNIREIVLFAQHDVVLDPPFTKLDLLFCRNLLIYFDATLQRRLLPLFHYSLRPGGVLVLGTSETVGRFAHLFAPLQSKLRIYDRQNVAAGDGLDVLTRSFPPLSSLRKEPRMAPPTPPRSGDNLKWAADDVLLQVYAPAAVVLNGDGDIVYISGRTGKYLEPAAGRANWNVHSMAREGLRASLADALKRASAQHAPVQLPGLEVAVPGGGAQVVDVTVQALHEPAALQGMIMVVFRDVFAPQAIAGHGKAGRDRDTSRSAELQRYRDEMQALREEARASREELQSANEELQSTNEELQSTNEELTSSKEEMQSMNEELQTVNAELQSRLDDLALAQSDMQNVLNSIEIAILFLDGNLNVRRYTERAAKIISLRESDVGRPLSDLTTTLQYPALHDDALETLRTLMPCESQIAAADGRWFTVRIMPYRRLDNLIDGVVITLVDITESKRLESALKQSSDS